MPNLDLFIIVKQKGSLLQQGRKEKLIECPLHIKPFPLITLISRVLQQLHHNKDDIIWDAPN